MSNIQSSITNGINTIAAASIAGGLKKQQMMGQLENNQNALNSSYSGIADQSGTLAEQALANQNAIVDKQIEVENSIGANNAEIEALNSGDDKARLQSAKKRKKNAEKTASLQEQNKHLEAQHQQLQENAENEYENYQKYSNQADDALTDMVDSQAFTSSAIASGNRRKMKERIKQIQEILDGNRGISDNLKQAAKNKEVRE